MPLILALIATALADDAAIITVPLPDMAAEVVTEAAPWAPDETREGPPLAWSQVGEHRIGGEHLLYGADGEIALTCEIQAFELRSTETGAWASDGVEVWARLDCGSEAVAWR
ncbi:MAG: hypothetical protein ACI8RZ_006714 [Myxococcota bacterium]|jgi:hypothetical protein